MNAPIPLGTRASRPPRSWRKRASAGTRKPIETPLLLWLDRYFGLTSKERMQVESLAYWL